MKKNIFIFLAVVFIASFLTALSLYHYSVTPCKSTHANVRVNIPQGSSLRKISLVLNEKDVIVGTFRFMLLARLKNAEHKIKSGEYSFTHPISPLEILDKLTRGEVITHAVTIPEGSTIYDIARIIEGAGLGSFDSILKKATDLSFVKLLGIDNESLEGFLYPDTYRFSKGTGPEVILKSMAMRFKEVFVQELKSKASGTGLSEKDIIILASLVEKETAQPSEKPIIAAVFLNRLKKRIRLACDPTVIYGIRLKDPQFRGGLRKKHLKRITLYNTYLISGLPPGPICNPGLESMKAVLKPAKADYLYFVSKNDGTHKFSKTLEEHNRAVYMYQKSR